MSVSSSESKQAAEKIEEIPERKPNTASHKASPQATESSRSAFNNRKEDKKKKWVGKLIKWILIVILCIVVVTAPSVIQSKTYFKTVFYEEVSQYLTENLRIVFLSDLHGRQYGADNSLLIDEVWSLEPDIILLGGDMINRDDADIEPVLNFCGRLTQIAPVYGVLGNHESERIYGRGDSELVARFEERGVVILRNEMRDITLNNNVIQLIGAEGTEYGFDEYGGRKALDEMEFRKDRYRILIDHYPILFARKLASYSFNLGLAGHVHGGIVHLPGVGGLYSKEEGFFPKYCQGEYPMRGGARLIISGGLGDSGWFPRIYNVPELVVIDVNWC